MAHSTSDTAFLTVEKSFTYEGAREHWANVYHLDQIPADATAWNSLASAVWGYEQQGLPADVQVERYTGHNPGTPPLLVWESDVPPAGEGGIAGVWVPSGTDFQTPGNTAGWIRWGTTQKTSLGKPIYLRNYYHGVYWAGTRDTWSAGQKVHFDTLGNQWKNGFIVSGVTFRRAGPRGAVAQNSATSQFLTTRTLKRRGKRKKTVALEGKAGDVPVLIPGWLGNILDEAFPG